MSGSHRLSMTSATYPTDAKTSGSTNLSQALATSVAPVMMSKLRPVCSVKRDRAKKSRRAPNLLRVAREPFATALNLPRSRENKVRIRSASPSGLKRSTNASTLYSFIRGWVRTPGLKRRHYKKDWTRLRAAGDFEALFGFRERVPRERGGHESAQVRLDVRAVWPATQHQHVFRELGQHLAARSAWHHAIGIIPGDGDRHERADPCSRGGAYGDSLRAHRQPIRRVFDIGSGEHATVGAQERGADAKLRIGSVREKPGFPGFFGERFDLLLVESGHRGLLRC